MKISTIKLTSIILGVVGSLMGYYIWKDYIPEFYGDTTTEWRRILRLEYLIFLYIPSSFSLISIIFNKTYLMYIAFILSVPLTRFLGVQPLIIPDTFPLVYYPVICYFISAIIMTIGKLILIKKNK